MTLRVGRRERDLHSSLKNDRIQLGVSFQFMKKGEKKGGKQKPKNTTL